MLIRTMLIAPTVAGCLLLGAAPAPQPEPRTPAQEQPPEPSVPAGERQAGESMPDLVEALKASRGCLGVELARTQSGKNVIFAWFQDKQAVLRWYFSEPQQQVLDRFFPGRQVTDRTLDEVPDDAGPIMVIASVTLSQHSHFQQTRLPVSQLAVELYVPIPGGVSLGGRFAPEAVRIPEAAGDASPSEES